jgi:hypothetical protein
VLFLDYRLTAIQSYLLFIGSELVGNDTVMNELPYAADPGVSIADEDMQDAITDDVLAQVKFAQKSRESSTY